MDKPEPFSGTRIPPDEATRLHHAPARVERKPPPPFSRLFLPIAALVLVVIAFQQIAQPDLGRCTRDPVIRLVTLAVALATAGLFALFRYELVLPSTLAMLGLAFEVLVAFAIALVETSVPLAADRPVLGISAVGPWILFVGVLMPERPRWTLIAGVAAASMWPLAYAINASRLGFVPPQWGRLIVWPGINYVMAVLAWLIGRRLFGPLHETAEAADEMGKYRLLAPIGAGGMGEVWKASHEMLARQAAIKLVRPLTKSTTSRQMDLWVERFRREANVIAGLQSPHTIYLYDFGVSRDGQFYYVMELLDGISLQTLVATFGPQPAARVRAIAAADLRVARGGAPAEPRASRSQAVERDAVQAGAHVRLRQGARLRSGQVRGLRGCRPSSRWRALPPGTPGYIAPEVALGEDAGRRPRRHLRAGLRRLLSPTGTLVFPDSNPMTMALKHVQAMPDPPSARTALPIPPIWNAS